MTKTNQEVEVKLCRLNDIVFHHIKKHNPEATLEDITTLERDIKVWVKNLLLSMETLDLRPDVHWVGDNHKNKEALGTD